ncbi:MAG: hypothetical protein HY902_02800 [Deltaproteobacteria bacterium]|nr:hypothetical protein [Deltaproteobacteria bacterium]
MSDAQPRFVPAAPLVAQVLESAVLAPNDGAGEVCALEIGWQDGDLQWRPGQSVGVLPPGLNARGRPNVARLYSLANACRAGERRLTLLVRRSVHRDRATGEPGSGLCSSYLCDARPGDVLRLTGPVGHILDLPESPRTPWILLATGTGIAPFRGFLQHWQGLAASDRPPVWLIHGARSQAELAWHSEFAAQAAADPKWTYQAVRSREGTTSDGERPHVDHVLGQQLDKLTDWLDHGAVLYCCGVRGMVPGVEAALARATGLADAGAQLERDLRLRVEVY